MSTPTRERSERLESRRESIRQAAEAVCLEARSQGQETLNAAEARRIAAMQTDLRDLDESITEYRADLKRAVSQDLGGRTLRVHPKAASRLTSLAFSDEALRDAHTRARRGEAVSLETREFTSGVSLLQPELFPVPTFPRHEGRLLDRLQGYALDAPSLEYVQVNSVTGSAGIVGGGQPKPEVDMPATKLVCTALKLAVHAGISWENVLDYDALPRRTTA